MEHPQPPPSRPPSSSTSSSAVSRENGSVGVGVGRKVKSVYTKSTNTITTGTISKKNSIPSSSSLPQLSLTAPKDHRGVVKVVSSLTSASSTYTEGHRNNKSNYESMEKVNMENYNNREQQQRQQQEEKEEEEEYDGAKHEDSSSVFGAMEL